MRKLLVTAAVAAFAAPAFANEAPAVAPAGAKIMTPGRACPMQENVNLNINFNFKVKSFAEAKTKFEDKIKQVEEFAQQQQVKKFELQSMSYNISSQVTYDNGMPESGYQMNGNAGYVLDSADAAFKLAEFLTQQKFQVNVSVNKYRNGACGNVMLMQE